MIASKQTRVPHSGHHDTAVGSEYFGIERGHKFVRRFKLYLRDGQVISIPYAYLPIVIYEPDRCLNIKTNDLDIRIKGRGLNVLTDFLNEEKVQWIKESPSGIDDETGAVFVRSIAVDGELMG